MKLRSLVVVVVILLASLAATARAQTGLYLNPIAMRISNSTADNGLFAFLGQNSTSHMFYGESFGAYYDFKTPYPFRAGVDVRDAILHGGSAAINSFQVGVRLSGHPFHNAGWKPYIEPYVGAGTTRAPSVTIRVTKPEFGALAGIDYQTHHHIDFRAIEIGYSKLITASSETIGGSDVIPTSTLYTVSTGFVIRFP